ncbi:hypothetical protein BofuT4_uP033420.1 [Botrytis cinerea T4]|uniref:Uncharacterized protein n=1 Tax=Botryotinia fuckeliana (strain T4) TaxID=999810 RepID=G2Y7X2_BOTF4|nr:hypothetical protein BofuT4_uP033420.1 [Botrytis cinerea T4]
MSRHPPRTAISPKVSHASMDRVKRGADLELSLSIGATIEFH